PYVVDGIAFLIVLKGTGKIKINLREYRVEKNTIMTMLPGFIVEIIERSEDILVEHLFFSFDFLANLNIPKDSELPAKVEESPCIGIPEDKIYTLLDYHSFIVKQYKQNNHIFRKEISQNLLSAMLIEIHSIYLESRTKESSSNTRQEDLFNKFIQLLYKHIKKERSVSFYAKKLFLSPKYLAQIVKKTSGRLALDWINEFTILLMKALLKSSTMTVTQISDELNFPNPSFFGRYFKKQTGMTPLEYREKEN
ncbi:MAG: helix-turn-helix domain-containing protein, partial [Prevotella sp.]|nr:helix-turn-helix domain-containing protein [Prevotella sp.]